MSTSEEIPLYPKLGMQSTVLGKPTAYNNSGEIQKRGQRPSGRKVSSMAGNNTSEAINAANIANEVNRPK